MKGLKRLTVTAQYMLYAIGGLFLAFLLLGILFIQFIYPLESVSQYALGLLTGCLVSAVRIVLMDKSINRVVDMEEKKAKNYNQMQFLIRYYIVIGYAVLLVVLQQYLGVFGGVLGLLCMQLSAYAANFVLNKRAKKEK